MRSSAVWGAPSPCGPSPASPYRRAMPASTAHKPFCGQGCRDRDLLNWLGEGYRVPGPAADPDAAAPGDDGLDSER